MGCDIHTVVQYRGADNKWKNFDKCPSEFYYRDYDTFALLAGVRDYNKWNISEPKGLPEDLGARQVMWYSEMPSIVSNYENKSVVAYKDADGTLHNPCCEKNVKKLSKEEYNSFKEEVPGRYFRSFASYNKDTQNIEYFCYDASITGGIYVEAPVKEVFPKFREYLKEYEDIYNEEMNDYGFWEIDFDCLDFHSHSYADIEDLEETLSQAKRMGLKKEEYAGLKNGIKELKKYMKEIGIKNPWDIRIVFAFDN